MASATGIRTQQMNSSAKGYIEQALSGLAPGKPYAIVDYPNYANPGDCAIWLGARRALESIYGYAPAYVSTVRQFDARRCREKTSEGTIFFLGGGNFGSLYEKHHRMRLRALDKIADLRIVLLPLSVAERDPGNPALIAETRSVVERCLNLKVLVRERNSMKQLRETYRIEGQLCPDTAHWCHISDARPTTEAVGLFRKDGEALPGASGNHLPSGDVFDWRDNRTIMQMNRLGKISPLIPSRRLRLAAFDSVAKSKVKAASKLLGRGNRVLTDRLHGVILASLMKREVAAADNKTGKVGAYVNTWPHLLPHVTLN
ncbi:polysaccharide pyruvyl transferase family protein [Hoeflea prorocentri]|uniref:Polysaccharide pyruvyl transferase family protein n=1 Tax=Hoeflea prorocentri TaxID=1922333 RepID=A0A9X3ZJY1_9HYPH|nr:polysaccharide pyruvyl transferase family protein [Hoeflea prorocentri]MCY6383476.1 polysaccharide pyruvyl transferase family protein [Hoeflea prorocentri]MDA5401276.1 polysaccharide pyruvyl transferase family protein [Hoeflea prorocentri]